jgi:hypothetical protein
VLATLALIFKFFGASVLPNLIAAYQAKLTADTKDEKIAADLAANEIAAQITEAQLHNQLKIAEIGHPWEPERLAMYIVLLHLAKCVVWDTMFGWGSTPALRGDIASWEGMIITWYFGKRGFENVARILKR